jgi:phage recombination protein Bet
MSTQLATQSVSFTPFGQSEELTVTFQDVRELIAVKTRQGKGPSDKDVNMFLHLCKASGLNPYVKDAYLLGYDSRDGPVFNIISSIKALEKRADAHPQFDGIESGLVVVSGDGEIKDIPGAMRLPGFDIIGGWAKVWRKDHRLPHEARLELSVYSSGKSRWQADPAGMIVKCSKAAAYREAFPTELGGIYTSEEQDGMEQSGDVQDVREVAGREVPVSAKPATPKVEEPSLAHDELLTLLEDEAISEAGFLAWANAQPTSPKGGYPSYLSIPMSKCAGLIKVWDKRGSDVVTWIRENYKASH